LNAGFGTKARRHEETLKGNEMLVVYRKAAKNAIWKQNVKVDYHKVRKEN
jgi:hypothetical protein